MKFITAILSAFFCLSIQAQLVTYPGTLSTGMPHNDDYTVRVRIPGGEWKDLFEYKDRKSTRLNSSHNRESRMPSSA